MKDTSLKRRYLSLWLPRLPTDRLAKLQRQMEQRPTSPTSSALPKPPSVSGGLDNAFVCVEAVRGAQRLSAVNAAAARLRLKPGMTLSDARAMYPTLTVMPADTSADLWQLETIAEACERYTPLVALDASTNLTPNGLFLDITGCAHLFGGEDALLTDIIQRLKRYGFTARGAIASTPGCAWAMARFGQAPIVAAKDTANALLPLPLASLRLSRESVNALAEAGLHYVADLIARPRAPIAARFGEHVLARLDQATGRDEESINPRTPIAPCVMEQDFIEAITREDDVLTVIAALAVRMGVLLEQRGEGARTLEAVLFRLDGVVNRLMVGTSRPLRDPKLIRRLFADRLKTHADDYDAGFGFEKIRLRALAVDTLEAWQSDLTGADSTTDSNGEFGHLVDRLGVRLSTERVLVLQPHDSHIPEFAHSARAAQRTDFLSAPKKHTPKIAQDSLAPARPIRLLEKPEPISVSAVEVPEGCPTRFRWRGIAHRTSASEGPERIAMEWWRDDKGQTFTRDYFRVESETGGRFWLFREGLFGRETASSNWFVHGLFG